MWNTAAAATVPYQVTVHFPLSLHEVLPHKQGREKEVTLETHQSNVNEIHPGTFSMFRGINRSLPCSRKYACNCSVRRSSFQGNH